MGIHKNSVSKWYLNSLGMVAVAQNQPERGARLFAAAEALREAMNVSMVTSPSYRADYERSLIALRAALDEKTLAAAWAEGRAMSMEEAVEYALSVSV